MFPDIDYIRDIYKGLVEKCADFMAGFREQTGWDRPLYTDPSLEVFAAAQLKRGARHVLTLRALVPTVKAFARGGRQGLPQGDPWQQGGVLVVAPTGDIVWHHASDHPGDNASGEQILATL